MFRVVRHQYSHLGDTGSSVGVLAYYGSMTVSESVRMAVCVDGYGGITTSVGTCQVVCVVCRRMAVASVSQALESRDSCHMTTERD